MKTISTNIPTIVTDTSVTLFLNGKTLTAHKSSNSNYSKIVARVKTKAFKDIEDLFDIQRTIEKKSKGEITVRFGKVFYNNAELRASFVTRLLTMIREGFDVKPLKNLLTKALQNEKPESADQLFLFLEKNNLPICEDGDFLAFKRVQENYLDFHTGKFHNIVGQVIKMDRKDVVFDRNSTCSSGLHVCSRPYLDSFNKDRGRIMVVKVNPANVVSVPVDYQDTKMRVCEYTVIQEIEEAKVDDLKEYNLHRSVLVNYHNKRNKAGRFVKK